MMDRGCVLITGCSSGIGWACAERLHQNGWHVIATARTDKDSARMREQGWQTHRLDVRDSPSIQKLVSHIFETYGRLDGIVNNAGFGMPGAVEDLSREAMREQFEVNLFGGLELTNALMPLLFKSARGRIIHVSSLVGRMSLPFMGIYSASKFALEAIADAQRIELSATDVGVVLVEPGPIKTHFSSTCVKEAEQFLATDRSRFRTVYHQYFQQRQSGGMAEDRFRLPPEAVARKIEKALLAKRPKARYKVTWPTYVADFMTRFLPDRVRDAFVKRAVVKRYGTTQAT
jgi:NAD(P)-dependent dehydrogenase (short-subunit alcohol dehydrogenase family)